jgi:2-keto-4-pentenoate hydratase/2-oxohepta-3-ene-1,7-dioic acid hydratase in catechol pathway
MKGKGTMMKIDRRSCLLSLAAGGAAGLLGAAPGPVLSQDAASKDLKGVKLLFPCEPSKIRAMAGNYKSHLQDQAPPKNPEAFFKPPSALLEAGGTIVLPRGSADVHYEGELVVVIGKRASRVSRADAPKHIFGYTCGNDVSARDWQKNDRQWWRAKGCDTFAALGPWISAGPGFNAGDLLLTTKLNGKEVQHARTSELIYDVAAIVSFLSDHVTLLPGDLIYTGTPGTTSAMKPGDVVEVAIEGIGVLKNTVG